MKNNVWKKFLAGLSAAAILVTSLGVMPIVSADESAPAEITETKLIEKITFDGYGESVSGEIEYNLKDAATSARTYFFNSDGHRLDAKAVFKAQANISVPDTIVGNNMKFFYGGTVTTSLPERADGNRYFAGGTLTYKEVTFVDTNEDGTVDTRQEAETTKTTPTSNVVYSLDNGAANNPFYTSNAKIEAGEQIVYEVAVRPSLTFSISPRVNGDYLTSADPRYFKNGLYKIFEVKSDNKLYIYDIKWNSETTKMESSTLAAITLPKTKDDWYDLKIVYTCTKDGSHEKVYAYVDGVCLYLGDMTSRVHAKTPSRADFNGQFDDFAITKYDGIKYDGINATTVVALQDFNSFSTSTIKAGDTISHFDGIITGNGTSKDHIVNISSKQDDQNDKYIDGVEYTGETQFYGNTSANRNLDNGGLIAGEQMVFNFSTRSDKKFNMYVRTYGAARDVNDYWDSKTSTTKKNTFKWGDGCIYLWTIENGKLYIHPGHLENASASNAIAYIDLPASSWVDIKAVYTAYADHTSAAFYINGKLALPMLKDGTDIASATGELSLPTNISYTYKTDAEGTEKTIGPFPVMPFTYANGTAGKINRFNITYKEFTLDNFEVTRYDGIKFDPADAIEHHISSGTPQEKEVLNIMTFDDTELWVDQAPTTEANYYNGLIHLKSGAKVTMVQDGEGDQSAEFTTGSDTPWINPNGTNTGIIDGEQFVVSLDAKTATDLKFSPIIYQGYKSNVSSSRVKIETLFKIDKGKLVHSNGGGIVAWAGVGDYRNNFFSYDLPADSWVNLYLVYTKKAVGMDVDIYVDGELVKSESLPYNYLLNGPIQRIHTETGHIDNLCIKTYRFGAEFNPNSIPNNEEAPVVYELIPTIDFESSEVFDDVKKEDNSLSLKCGENTFSADKLNKGIAVIQEPNGNKYARFTPVSGEGVYMAVTNNSNLSFGNDKYTDLLPGDQLYFSADVKPSVNTKALEVIYKAGSTSERVWNTLFEVTNYKLKIGNGVQNGYINSLEYALPYVEWVNVTLIYTIGSDPTTDPDSVSVYVNGTHTGTANMTQSGVVGGHFQPANGNSRLEFIGAFDNIRMASYEGVTFDVSTLPQIPLDYSILLPEMTFNNLSATNSATANAYDASGKRSMIYLSEGDKILSANGKGKDTSDKYAQNASGGQLEIYASSNNMLKLYSGLEKGEQLVINTQINPSADSNLKLKYGTYSVVNANNTFNEIANYITIFNFKKPADNNKFSYLNVYSGENYNDDGDGIDEEVIKSVIIPKDRWSTVTVVLEAGDASITTEGVMPVEANPEEGVEAVPGVAEVVTAETPDKMSVYVNGELIVDQYPLSDSNLFRNFERIDLQGKGDWDNFSITQYTDGLKYTFESPLADEEFRTSTGYNGGAFFLQDKTLTQLDAAIKANAKVKSVKYITSAGVVVTDLENNASTVKYASITGVDGIDYIVNIAFTRSLVDYKGSADIAQVNLRTHQNITNRKDKQGNSLSGNFSEQNIVNLNDTNTTLVADNYKGTTELYGKDAADEYLSIPNIANEQVTGDYKHNSNNDEEGSYTVTTTHRLTPISSYILGTQVNDAEPLYFSFDILANSTSSSVSVCGSVWMECDSSTNGRNGGTSLVSLYLNGATSSLRVSTDGKIGASNSATYGKMEWHNIAMQFIPGQKEFKVYLDGVEYPASLKANYVGINQLYMDIGGSVNFDNMIVKTGIYTPAVPGVVELAVAEDANLGRGIVWDGNKVVTNKSANGLAYNADIAAAFSTPTEGATVVLLDANGAVATEGSAIAQIAVRGADGFIKYFKVTKRTGTDFVDEGDGKYILDVADGSNYTSNDVVMFIVTYNAEDNSVAEVEVYNPTVDGDTCFFDDVEYDSAAQSMFIFNLGNLIPLK